MKKMTVILMSIILTNSLIFPKSINTSFKVGLPYSSVQFLLGDKNVQGKNFTPTIGLSYFGFSINSKYTEDGDSEKRDMSMRFLVPRVGVRILGNRVNDLNSYYIGEAFIVLPFISGSDLSSEDVDELKDATDLIGATFGWGVEYYFSESFSIGGEATFNMLFHSITRESNDDYDSYKSEFNARIGATITQITFNYYF